MGADQSGQVQYIQRFDYDYSVTYNTVIDELFLRFPELREQANAGMYDNDGTPLHYVIFGHVLLPALEAMLRAGDDRAVSSMCAYLEEASVSSAAHPMLEDLIAAEIGEWLNRTSYEKRIAPWIGSETKRVCNYTPGLATQRLQVRAETHRQSLRVRLRSVWDHVSS